MDYDHPVISLDLLATFAQAAGSNAATEDSVGLLPYLQGTQTGAPHEYLYWRSGPTVAIRDAQWKLVRYNRTPMTRADLDGAGRLQPPEAGWPLDSPHGQITLLYDLLADPGETVNQASAHPEIVKRLEAAHAEWAASLGDPILPAIRSTLTDVHDETVQLIF